MRTLNVKANSTATEVLNQVASTLENDTLIADNADSIQCETNADDMTVTQYELDTEGEIANECVWYVDTDIQDNGLSTTVNIDC